MSPPRSTLSPDPAAAQVLVNDSFVPVRAKLIEVAAFLDRVERHGVDSDFRCQALHQAAAVLLDGQPERARRILESLSDPTTSPDEVSTGKPAMGAWQASANS
jgi:hypothetical protein